MKLPILVKVPATILIAVPFAIFVFIAGFAVILLCALWPKFLRQDKHAQNQVKRNAFPLGNVVSAERLGRIDGSDLLPPLSATANERLQPAE
jgi:hypothetical protein